jgi:hypothetical protein
VRWLRKKEPVEGKRRAVREMTGAPKTRSISTGKKPEIGGRGPNEITAKPVDPKNATWRRIQSQRAHR